MILLFEAEQIVEQFSKELRLQVMFCFPVKLAT